MTVSTLVSSDSWVSAGTLAPRSIPFPFIDLDDLRATYTPVSGSVQVLVRGTHYTITGNNRAGTAVFTPLVTFAAGGTFRTERVTRALQEYETERSTPLDADSIERELDRQAMRNLEQDRRTSDIETRAPLALPGQTAPAFDVSGLGENDLLIFKGGRLRRLDRAPFAGKFYAGGVDGSLVPSSGTGGGDTALRGDMASEDGALLLGDAKVPGIIRSQQDINRDGWNVFDFFTSYNRRQLVREFATSAAAECSDDFNDALASGEMLTASYGRYLVEGALVGSGTLKLRGAGIGKSIIQKPDGSADHVFRMLGTTVKRNVHISGFTMDGNAIDAIMVLEYLEDATIEELELINSRIWGLHLGVVDPEDAEIRNKRVKLRNIFCRNTTETYEHVLIFNSEDVDIDGFYASTGADGIGLGIYQNSDRITLRNFLIQNIKTAIYYSLSTRRIKIMDGMVRNTTSGIQGANLADNGAFGSAYAERIEAERIRFFGNVDCGMQIGAVLDARVSYCEFEGNLGPGLLINQGGIGVAGTPSLERRANRLTIEHSQFRNNNASNIGSINAPGIAFNGIGGDMDADLIENRFYDERGAGLERQLYPISFVGPHTWSNIRIHGGNLNAYGGAPSIGTSGGAVVDIELDGKIRGVTTTLPDGVHGATFTGSRTYNAPILAAGATTSPIDVTVTGAKKGDLAQASLTTIQGEMTLQADIVSNNTAFVYLTNRSADTINLDEGTLTVKATRP